MEFLELAKARYSVRRYSDKKVEQEKIDKIIEVARISPTAVNFRPQRLLVIDQEEGIEKLKKCTPFVFDVKTAFIVFYDKNESWKRSSLNLDYGPMDVSIVVAHMLLEATDLGLGAVYVGHFDHDILCKEFNVPDYLMPIAIVPVGYMAENSRPAKLHDLKKYVSQMTFYNSLEGIVPAEPKESGLK